MIFLLPSSTLPKIYDFGGTCSDFQGMAVRAARHWVAAADLPDGVAVHAAWPLWQLVYLRRGIVCSASAGLPEGAAVRVAQQLVYLMVRQLVYLRAWQCVQHSSWST
jgi:hypothetical protein